MLLTGRLPDLADPMERWLPAGVVPAALRGLALRARTTSAGAHGATPRPGIG